MSEQLIGVEIEESEQKRKSRLLNILIYSLAGLLVVVDILALGFGIPLMVSARFSVLGLFIGCVLSYWFNRRGWFLSAAYIYLAIIVIAANTFFLVPNISVESRGLGPFFSIIAVVAGGILIYPLASFWLAILGTAVLLVAVAVAGGPGFFTASGSSALGWGVIAAPVLASYIFASISWLFSSSMDKAFLALQTANEKLQAGEEELRAANEELQASEEELRATNEELQTANEELRETQEQLIRSERLAAIGQLAGGVGHELRNPLGAIKNAVYYIKGKASKSKLGQKEPRVMEFLDIMEDEINTSNKIINDLLGFSRVQKPSVSPTQIEKVIEDALSRTAIPENIEVTKKLDADLPEVEIDPDQIHQVFVNMIMNAVQAMPEGGKLTIGAGEKGRFLEVEVADTGCGIPGESADKIFDPLFTTKAKGIGLGLAVCKAIIDRHEGNIEVKSKVGKGSTFNVKLPLKRGQKSNIGGN